MAIFSSSEVNTVSVHQKIVAVVVTFNRVDLLPLTLKGIAAGDMVPDQVVVVDNASTDSTRSYLEGLDYPLPLDTVYLPKNVGGAGGFTVGIDRALIRHEADLVWVMDDDTEPTANTLSQCFSAWENYSPVVSQRPAFVASRVVWKNGQDHPMNTMRTRFGATAAMKGRAAAVGGRPIRSASFVSVMMDAAVMRRVGLPIADFFIWNDDFEYTTRLAHHREAIAVSSSVALHHTKTFGTTDANPGPRFYNDVRNKLWVFCRRRTLSPLEKFLYGSSTVRLWLSTLVKTDQKKTYTGYLLSGVRDALVSFRSNAEVLDGVYELEFPQIAQQPGELKAGAESKVSVLMSTYAADSPQFLERAIASNTVEQSRWPDELVLVKDGPLTPELEAVIDRWVERAEVGEAPALKVVALEHNGGLANALNRGLEACAYELVARADSDDISLPKRLERQLAALSSEQAVLGASMYEVKDEGAGVESLRQAVTAPGEISRLLGRRNPIFHPTVLMRKSAVVAVGGYEEVPGAEDYLLWCRLHRAGYRLANLSQPLVKYRVGGGAYERRGGVAALTKDLEVQRKLYIEGVTGPIRAAANVGVRGIYRLAPLKLRQHLFRAVIGRGRQSRFVKKGAK